MVKVYQEGGATLAVSTKKSKLSKAGEAKAAKRAKDERKIVATRKTGKEMGQAKKPYKKA